MSERPRHQVYLGLGANLGSRRKTLQAALQVLASTLAAVTPSSLYETAPWGPIPQPDFLNLCVAAETTLAPRPLLDLLKQIEQQLGRLPGERWGPRLIDIDLLLYDELIHHEPDLTIPHPRLTERAFVLVPLLELAPGLVHPQSGQSLKHALDALDRATVRRVERQLNPISSVLPE